jgi:hypothetical protein
LTYKVSVYHRPAAAVAHDSTLKSLTVSSTSLKPTFSSAVQTYADTVTNATASVTLTAVANDATDTVSYSVANPVALAVGSNPVTITVKNTNGHSLVYTVNIVRAAAALVAHDTTLKSLTVGSTTIPLVSGTVSYIDSVSSSTATQLVSAVANDATDTVFYNGTASTSGYTANLTTGSNAVTIKVKNTNGNSLTYTLNIARKAVVVSPTDTTLASLSISSGNLTPAFSSAVQTYIDTVDSAVSSVTLTAKATATASTLAYSGISTSSAIDMTKVTVGTSSAEVVTVTSSTGSLKYTVNIYRKPTPSGGTALALPNASAIAAGTYTITQTCTTQTSFQCAGTACSVTSGSTTYYSGSGYDFVWDAVVIPVGTTITITGGLNGMQCQ